MSKIKHKFILFLNLKGARLITAQYLESIFDDLFQGKSRLVVTEDRDIGFFHEGATYIALQVRQLSNDIKDTDEYSCWSRLYQWWLYVNQMNMEYIIFIFSY